MKITSDNQQNMWPLCRTPENRQGIYLKEFTRLIHVRLAGSLRDGSHVEWSDPIT